MRSASDTGPSRWTKPICGGPRSGICLPAPTLANVVAHPGPWLQDAGIDWQRLVHAEHRLTIHRPVPIDTPLLSRSRMTAIVDRGPEKGMFATFERAIVTLAEEAPVATIVQTNACRGDGGCGSAGTPPEPLAPVPARAPDAVFAIAVPQDAALLYRLNGDLNPLHSDPAYAARAGFPRPILHGLCTFGYAGYAIGRTAGAGAHRRCRLHRRPLHRAGAAGRRAGVRHLAAGPGHRVPRPGSRARRDRPRLRHREAGMTVPKPAGEAPHYLRIKDAIMARIAEGTFKPGDRVYSESELVASFGVSRMTANRALRELMFEGVLTRATGLGTFVSSQRQDIDLLQIRNIADEIAGRGRRPRRRS